jgi:PIN domain nuclease of toxin-antitoxin system
MGARMEAEAFLDTHVLVWLYEGELNRFSEKAKQVLENAPLWISPMALLELDYLFEVNKITVKSSKIYHDLQNRLDLQLADDSFSAVVQEASRLDFTRDCFDRIITAHARLRRGYLVTKDQTLRKHYTHCIW